MFQCVPLTFAFNFQEVLNLFFAGPLSGVIENRCAANTSTTTKPIRARVKEWFFKVFRKVNILGSVERRSGYVPPYFVQILLRPFAQKKMPKK